VKLYYTRNDCRLCGSTHLALALALAPMPIATPNFAIPGVGTDDPAFRKSIPLELCLCRACGLLQILHVGNPDIQYTHYVYTTSLSLGLAEHFKSYARETLAALRLAPGSLIVEMGSNDGTLLRHFRDAGHRVLGVDPALDIARRATAAGIETLGEYFTAELAARVRAGSGPATAIIANNVLANIDDLDSVTEGVRLLLADDGAFVFETQYGADVVEKNLLDTVYHEHLSYFNVKPLATHYARHGLEIFDVQRIWTKGGSIRVFVQPAGGRRPKSACVDDMIRAEEAAGYYDPARYERWAGEIAEIRRQLSNIADEVHASGRLVGGYGVSVGTTTLLPQFGLTDKIDVLFDDDPKKDRELVGPDYSIPVLPTSGVYDKSPGAIIIFAWRYAEPIIAKHRRYIENGGRFIVPLPAVSE
jgi:hypothetical protein